MFTDGAAKGNPGPGGWGAIVVTHDHVRFRELPVISLHAGRYKVQYEIVLRNDKTCRSGGGE